MDIYVDAGIKNNVAGIGVAVIEKKRNLLERYGEEVLEKDSHIAEIIAVNRGIQKAIKYNAYDAVIYSDNKSVVEKINEGGEGRYGDLLIPLISNIKKYNLKIRWISRKSNKIANGITRMVTCALRWDLEEEYGEKIGVVNAIEPGVWRAGNNVVSLHQGVFKCDCDMSRRFAKNKANCRHIYAVKRKINIINKYGERLVAFKK